MNADKDSLPVICISTPRSGLELLRRCMTSVGYCRRVLLIDDILRDFCIYSGNKEITELYNFISFWGDRTEYYCIAEKIYENCLSLKSSNENRIVVCDPFFTKILRHLKFRFDNDVLPASYLAIVRHPLEVAQALSVRDGIPFSNGLQLWLSDIFSILSIIDSGKYFIFTLDQIIANPSLLFDGFCESVYAHRSVGGNSRYERLFEIVQPDLKTHHASEIHVRQEYLPFIEIYNEVANGCRKIDDLWPVLKNNINDLIFWNEIKAFKPGEIETIIGWYDKYGEKVPIDERARLADKLNSMGEMSAARCVLQNIVPMKNHSPEIVNVLANIEISGGDWDRAITILEDFIGRAPVDKENAKKVQCKLLQVRHKLSDSLESHSYSANYSKGSNCYLSELCDRHGSDKGSLLTEGHCYRWPPHTYTDYYSRLFQHCRNSVKFVFECGIGTNNTSIPSNMTERGRPGASLRVWRDYFPMASIIGADIDRGCLFSEDRISTYYVDQTDPKSIDDLWGSVNIDKFDVMIDDGLHTFDAGKTLFENSIYKLADDGIYIIEDVKIDDLVTYQKYFKLLDFQVDFVELQRPKVALGDNMLIVIRSHF